ncbi:hypothetical protein DL765_009751 [Monosporascus sp. GIB2]|nr:hypothetical protein DL765_009751 [Monosporascus sp. GIB2]
MWRMYDTNCNTRIVVLKGAVYVRGDRGEKGGASPIVVRLHNGNGHEGSWRDDGNDFPGSSVSLRDIQIRISRLQTRQSITFDEIRRDNDVFACLELVIGEDHCDILANGISVATMNKRTHLALNSLSSAKVLKCSGLLSKAKLNKTLAVAAEPPGSGSPKLTCTMDILVFGPRTIGDVLARHLSRYRLFLQHPYPVPNDVDYENPQYLGMVGSSFSNGTILPPILVDTFQEEPDSSKKPDEDESVDLDNVMDNLPRHDYLQEANIEKGIEATLLRYKHIITGSERSKPEDILGGILADGMGLVAADFSRGGGVLNCFHWYRLVLDEAHVIRNRSTKQFKAVASLSASIRWCMTGTVVQNSLDDLASLISFLRVPLLEESATFRRHISGRRKTIGGMPRPDYANLKHLLGSICLRRSTSSVLSTLGVKFEERRQPLAEAERRAYDKLAVSCGQSIKAAVNGHSSNGGKKSILTAVLKLRIFCNTGFAGPIDSTSDDAEEWFWPDEVASLLQQSGEDSCADCGSDMLASSAGGELAKPHMLSQHRLKCEDCTQRIAKMEDTETLLRDETNIPSITDTDMMQDVRHEAGHGSALTTDPTDYESYPSKLKALLTDIKEHYYQEKSIIFSFWTRSLNLVGDLFRKEGVIFGRVDGGLLPSQRKKVLAEFHSNPSVRVLLMTIGTGAVGLNNLSVASRVHILEPQWNPYVEDQAIGRVFRLGQNKEVHVIRYIMETTVEESIESRQLIKMQHALKGGLRSSDQEVSESRRRIMHLQALGKIIESTVLTRGAGVSKVQSGSSRADIS